MTADELSAEQEEHLVYVMLREQGGIDPGRLGPVIDLAALGLVNAAWRNTCVEDWHAGGRMHDGDDPANEHWGQGGELRRRLPAEPSIVADRKLLRRVLRWRPWELSSEAAGWLVNAGIGYLRS